MKFVHISDLHFNPTGDGRTSRNIRDELVPYLCRQKFYADELLITGDYRHARFQKKEQEDIDAVVKYIRDIAEAVNISDVRHIHLVPGNHDRDRKKEDSRKYARIRSKYDCANGCFDKDNLDFLLQRFEYFRMVCDTLYGSENYWSSSDLHTYRIPSPSANARWSRDVLNKLLNNGKYTKGMVSFLGEVFLPPCVRNHEILFTISHKG